MQPFRACWPTQDTRQQTMATSRDDSDAGRLVLANATPFLWKRSAKAAKEMSSWNFPAAVHPGETVTVAISFKADGGHGQASYQVRLLLQHIIAALNELTGCMV